MSSVKKSKSTGLWALFAKLGSKFLGIFAKLFKLTKLGLLAASFAGYAALYNWKFAILILVAVGWHEQGHVWAMRKMSIKTKGWYAIPFIGGAAIAEEKYRTYGENAYIAIMGPIWGMLMALAAAGLYWVTGQPLWAATGAWMATLNLFNLLPITPLDGGQLIKSIAFSINKTLGVWFLGFSILLGVIVMWKFHILLFAILLVVGALEMAYEIYARRRLRLYNEGHLYKWQLPASMRDSQGNVKHYPTNMNWKQLGMTAAAYVGTIAGLVAILQSLSHVPGADLAANFFE